MKTSAMSIKIDPKIKQEAQKVADQLGFSLSAIINASLKELTRKKGVSFSLLNPSEKLKNAIRQSRQERKNGKNFGPFSDSKDFIKSLES